jgi:thiamine-monophosphate kinase
MRLSDVGEFGLIGNIRSICPDPGDRILLGIGDDAALIRTRPDYSLLLTTDALTEGIHYDLRYVPISALGWKSLAVNLSDVAAMGGFPVCCLVTIGLPDEWSVEDVRSLYQGISRCSIRYNCPVVGGDTVKTRSGSFVNVTVAGEVRSGKEKRRSGAKSGDLLCMTGELGGARTGLEVLQSEDNPAYSYPRSVARFLEPEPRLEEAGDLIRELETTSMIDISDGLTSEIRHLCEESSLGCVVIEENIAVSEEAIIWARKTGRHPFQFAIESGEEYELLFTVAPDILNRVSKGFSPTKASMFSIIGEMRPLEEGIQSRKGGELHPLTIAGWDHFKENAGGK